MSNYRSIWSVVFIWLAINLLTAASIFAQAIPTELGNFGEALKKIELKNYDGSSYSLASFSEQKLTLLILMAHDCPICQQYTGKFRALSSMNKELKVIGIAPSEGETKETVQAFVTKYKFDFPILLDSEQVLTHVLKGKVTPEVFLFIQNGEMIYRGKIDNWFYELGKYRNVITEHYLDDAISAALDGRAITLNKTEPIGCMLNMGMKHH